MKKTGKCPKCGEAKIIQIKDIWHNSGGGNISKSKLLFTEKHCAKIMFYICESCGYVENYLDTDELNKLK